MSIQLKGLCKSFGKDLVLDHVDLTLPDRGLIGLYGVSGAGKSTLLNILGSMDNRYRGSCQVGTMELSSLNEDERLNYRLKSVGFLRQSADLLELDSAIENVLLPYKALSVSHREKSRKKGEDLLALVGLKGKEDMAANKLSGGERQRVALAKALVNDPPLLLCDEPTGALDDKNAEMVFNVLKAVSKKALVIVVSHDRPRLERFSDQLYELCDGRISGKPKAEEGVTAVKAVMPIRKKERKRIAKVPFSFWLGHSYRILKEKKKRSFLLIGILAFSFASLLTSLYIKDSLEGKMEESFASIMGAPTLVVEKNNSSGSAISSVYAAPLDEAKDLLEERPDVFKDYGVSYLADFENYFPDNNFAYIPSRGKKHVIPGLSIRAVNDYMYLDDLRGSCAPETPPSLEDDQIVLGLPYASMANVCYALQILRSYEALGDYIEEKGLELIYEVQNDSWNYADQQILEIKGVTRSEVPTIYHYSREWSTYLLEFKMRFPTSDSQDNSLPWIMVKVPYLVPTRPNEFLEAVREDIRLREFTYEPASYDYEQTHCEIDKKCGLDRYYLFYADSKGLDEELLGKLEKIDGVKGLYTATDGSYWNYPSAFMSGFAQPFYVSGRKESITKVIDSMGQVKKEHKDLMASLPSGTVMGSYLKPAGSSLTFTNRQGRYIKGHAPIGIDEIGASSALYEELGEPKSLYVGATMSEKEVGEYIVRDIREAEIKISGVYESNFLSLGHEGRWTEDFFSYVLGMSSFYLEPTKAILEIDNEDGDMVIRQAGRTFPELKFSLPYKSVSESLQEVSGLLYKALLSFSILGLFFSLVLLVVSSILEATEGKKEKRLLYETGIPPEQIVEGRIIKSGLLISLAMLLALVFAIIVQVSMGYFIDIGFGGKGSLSFDPACLIYAPALFLIALLVSALMESLGKITHQKP